MDHVFSFRRWMAALLASVCLLSPACHSAIAENTSEPEVGSEAFEPAETASVGSHGEVDQSALLDLPTVEPQETIDINEIIAEEDMLLNPSEEPSEEESISFDTSDEYVSGDTAAVSDTEAPVETEAPAEEDPNQLAGNNTTRRIDVSSVQFSALTDASLGFTFNYPSNWVNIPGVRTVCFHEPVEDDDFPARIAISVKTMSHTVENDVLMEQLTKFMRTISRQYASSTFQSGKINKKDHFMNRTAFSNTYMAYYGNVEIKGFIIGCAVGKAIVVGHFCSTYEDYAPMKSLMRYMINSAQVLSDK